MDEAECSSEKVDGRSLYVTPFPHDATLDAMTEKFAGVAPVKSLRMRRHMATKDFRGSVFVEFDSQEIAEKVLPFH